MTFIHYIIGKLQGVPRAVQKPALGDLSFKVYIGVLLTIGIGAATYAATSWDVHSNPQMYLNASITSTQVDNIQLAAPKRNGTTIDYPTLSGGVLRLRSGTRVEDIYYSTGAVNSTTQVVTLYGVTRDLCFNVARSFTSCGNGNQFGRGTIVELSNHHLLFNLKANIDRANTFTASGSVAFSGSGSFNFPTFATEAARDQQLIGTEGKGACVTGTGQCYDYIAGAWRSRSGSNVANASESVAGKLEFATIAEQGARTATGSTSAILGLQALYTISDVHLAYSAANVICGTGATATLATWTGTTDGSFAIHLDGTDYDVTSIDFTGDTNLSDVASTIQTAVQAATGGSETVTWQGGTNSGFTITSDDLTVTSSGSFLSAVSPATGTDISGEGATAYMACDDAETTTVTVNPAIVNPPGDAYRTVLLSGSGYIHPSMLGSGSTSPTATLFRDGQWKITTSSGANLLVDEGARTTDVTVSGTSYSAIDATNLSEAVYVESGALVMVTFTGNVKSVSPDPNSHIIFNVQVDGNLTEAGSGGILNASMADGSSTVIGLGPISFTEVFVNQTTGTRTIRIVAKVNNAGTSVTFNEPLTMQVIKFE